MSTNTIPMNIRIETSTPNWEHWYPKKHIWMIKEKFYGNQ